MNKMGGGFFMKKVFLLGVVVGILISCLSIVFANSYIQAILNDQINVSLDGQIQVFRDETTNEIQYPITYHDRTYLPLRTVANLVGVGVDYDSASNTAILSTQKVINVSTEEELLKAVENVQSNTKIILASGQYHVSLVFSLVENVTIEGMGETKIIVDNDYEKVIAFYNCKNIKIKNLVLGHKPAENCSAGCVELSECQNVAFENCGIYGCGVYAISAHKTNNVLVKQSKIYDTSSVGLELIDCSDFSVTDSDMYDNYSVVYNQNSSNVNINSCNIYNNKRAIANLSDNTVVSFNNCKIYNNEGDLASMINHQAQAVFDTCTFSNNSFTFDAFCIKDVENNYRYPDGVKLNNCIY